MESLAAMIAPAEAARVAAFTLLVGVAGGVAGIGVYLVLQAAQTIAFGLPFRSEAEAADAPSAVLRLSAMVAAGLVAATAWWAIRRFGRPVVGVEGAVGGTRMPAPVTLANAAVQVVAVGLGASIGKEAAPREVGAWLGQTLLRRARLTPRQVRVLVACGAAAGLAAVYDVPLGGALFAVEVLLGELTLATAVPALVTSTVAALVARAVIPVETLYRAPHAEFSPSLVVFAVLVGPLLGLAGAGFAGGMRRLGGRPPRGWRILVVMPVAFAAVGAVAIWFPQILGNGRALGLFAINSSLGDPPSATGGSVGLAGTPGSTDGLAPVTVTLLLLLLAVVKAGATSMMFGSGAVGGTLTPSIAIGAAVGAGLGGLWELLWPGSGLVAFGLVGAAAFLATTLGAPFTAVALVVEFTDQGLDILIPCLLAVGGATAVAQLLGRRRLAGIE